MTNDNTANLKIDRNAVRSVYSGRNGKCCCGCSGNHRYASQHVKAAGIHRGYAVDSDEVSDRSVSIVCGKIEKASREGFKVGNEDGHIYAVVGTRLYVAYFV